MTNIGAIIFARMSSSRFPGKTLIKIGKKNLLERVVDRVKLIKNLDNIIIATSTNSEDDAIDLFAKKKSINIFRGDLNNVLNRSYKAAKKYKLAAFLRINADRPFIDYKVYNRMIIMYKKNRYDLISNNIKDKIPRGFTAELISTNTIKKILDSTKSRLDKEHITRYIYKQSSLFNIKFCNDNNKYLDIENQSLVVDSKEDLNKIQFIIKKLGKDDKPSVDLKQILSISLKWNDKKNN